MHNPKEGQGRTTQPSSKKIPNSIFEALRSSSAAVALSALASISSIGCSDSANQPAPSSQTPDAGTQQLIQHPILDAGKEASTAKIDPLNPPPEIVQEQEKTLYAGLYDRAAYHWSKVLSYDAKEQKGTPTFFLDPYHGFEIAAIAIRPDELKTDDEKQVWRNDQRRALGTFEPTALRYRIRLDPKKELPLAAVRTNSIDDTFEASQHNVKLGRKSMPLVDALESLTKANFRSTKIYRYLIEKRKEDCKSNIADLESRVKEYRLEISRLKKSKDPADVEKLELTKTVLTDTLEDLTEYREGLANPNQYANEFVKMLVNGLIPQESQYKLDPGKTGAGAVGVWQITPDALAHVNERYPHAHYTDADRTNLVRATQIAIKYFDIIFEQIQAEVEKFDQRFPESDATVLAPALLTAYHSGYNRLNGIIEGFLQTVPQDFATDYDANNQVITTNDIFFYMLVKYFHKSRYETHDKFDDESLTYAIKISAWEDLMAVARGNQSTDHLIWKIADNRPSDLNIYYPSLPNEEKYTPNEEEPPRPMPSSVLIVPSGKIPAPPQPAPSASSSANAKQAPPEKPSSEKPALSGKPEGKSLGLSLFIPEKTALTHSTHVPFPDSPVGPITITSAFMESSTHSMKNYPMPAIFGDGHVEIVPPGNINLGIDYVIPDDQIKVWYGGKIKQMGLDGGYGFRITIATDVTYRFKGHDYPVIQAYGHMDKFAKGMHEGSKVHHGEFIGIMGGTGKGGRERYAHHVDLRTTIQVPDANGHTTTYDLSLNALDTQLRKQK